MGAGRRARQRDSLVREKWGLNLGLYARVPVWMVLRTYAVDLTWAGSRPFLALRRLVAEVRWIQQIVALDAQVELGEALAIVLLGCILVRVD